MNFSFKTLFFILLSTILSNCVSGQVSTGLSTFYVNEKNSLPIGFQSFDISYSLHPNKPLSVNAGMRFVGAATGKRGGFFAFGFFGELRYNQIKKLQLGINSAFLAGGGAMAPDKDGWFLQEQLFLHFQANSKFSIRSGLNYSYVSSGQIQGFSPFIGINWNIVVDSTQSQTSRFRWNTTYAEIGYGRFKKMDLAFVGAGAAFTIGRHFGGEVGIHALTNVYGGYMQILSSLGPRIGKTQLHVTPGIVLGLGGGGSVQTKGGGLYGGQINVEFSGKSFHTGIKYQYVSAFSNLFSYNGGFLTFGKTLNSTSKTNWYPVVKTYVGSGGFSNIGARFIAYEYKKLQLMGSTYWAFTNNRGAYAEGLFEASLSTWEAIPFYFIVSAGTGAGGDINKATSALLLSGGIGFTSPWKKIPLALEAGVWKGGNIPKWSFSLSYKI